MHFNMSFAISFNFDQSKILSSSEGLKMTLTLREVYSYSVVLWDWLYFEVLRHQVVHLYFLNGSGVSLWLHPGRQVKQEGHDGPVSLHWLIREIHSYQTLHYLGIGLNHKTPYRD